MVLCHQNIRHAHNSIAPQWWWKRASEKVRETIVQPNSHPLRMRSSLTKIFQSSRTAVRALVKYSIDCCYQHVRRVVLSCLRRFSDWANLHKKLFERVKKGKNKIKSETKILNKNSKWMGNWVLKIIVLLNWLKYKHSCIFLFYFCVFVLPKYTRIPHWPKW